MSAGKRFRLAQGQAALVANIGADPVRAFKTIS